MQQNKIFGPFSSNKFVSFALILGISFYLNKNFETTISLPLTLLMVGAFIIKIINSPKEIIDEEYLKRKKETVNGEKFDLWIKKAQANIQSQINLRKLKGATPDPKLEKMNEVLEKFGNGNKEV